MAGPTRPPTGPARAAAGAGRATAGPARPAGAGRGREPEPDASAPDAESGDGARRGGERRRDAGATRARILRAATQEFARHGFGGARGDRIARRARSSERMVYSDDGSKDGLFRAVLEAAYEALGVAEQALVLDDKPPREALAHFCRFVWRWYAEHPEFIGVLTAENQLQARHLRRSARLDVLVAPVVRMLAGLLARGVHDGAFRPGIDPSDLYVSIAGLGYFRVSNRHTLSAVLGRDLADPGELEDHWRACEEMVLRYVDARIQSAG
jgi:AcrR family transcriptional regulator